MDDDDDRDHGFHIYLWLCGNEYLKMIIVLHHGDENNEIHQWTMKEKNKLF